MRHATTTPARRRGSHTASPPQPNDEPLPGTASAARPDPVLGGRSPVLGAPREAELGSHIDSSSRSPGATDSPARRRRRASRGGSASWPRAKPLSRDVNAAVGYFIDRARRRNPAVPAAANGLVIVEADLNVPGDAHPALDETRLRVSALTGRLKLVFPRTVIVRSRRGLHFYFKPPPGCARQGAARRGGMRGPRHRLLGWLRHRRPRAA